MILKNVAKGLMINIIDNNWGKKRNKSVTCNEHLGAVAETSSEGDHC